MGDESKGGLIVNNTKHPLKSDLLAGMKRGKVVSSAEAVNLLKNNDVVAWGGFIGIGFAEELAIALENRFLSSGEPKDLTLLYSSGLGDSQEKGTNHLAHKGLLKRVICGHWGLTPKLAKLAIENEIEAYNLPQGVISCMFRDIAAKRPCLITKVGLGTFVDPRLQGGKINERTKEDIVEVMNFAGNEYLAYYTTPIDVAIIRATTADLDGNLTMEKEALTLDVLSIAMAAKNSGGLVIAQVERIADRAALPMREVKIPGILVDCVVVAAQENHLQTWNTPYSPAFAGEYKIPVTTIPHLPLDERKIMARRAAFELVPNSIVNLGLGVPEGIANVAAEEGILDLLTLTAEPGVIGGIPASGLDFGAATNVYAIIDQPYQFDFYDGGGLDIAFLGLAQADSKGNLNVSKFGTHLSGAGGFINISQNAKKAIFVGTFTAGGLKVAIDDGNLKIIREGKVIKFVDKVEQITFSGEIARKEGKSVKYITERCVFELSYLGLVLTEIAKGISIEDNILPYMEFSPLIAEKVTFMDERIFKDFPMNIKKDLLSIPIKDRLILNKDENLFFVNFEGLTIRSIEDIEEIKTEITRILEPLHQKVNTIVNYDNFDILPELVDSYMQMVSYVVGLYYDKVTRYTTSAFMRLKLGDTLKERLLAPHIYETSQEARKALNKE